MSFLKYSPGNLAHFVPQLTAVHVIDGERAEV
jgi:hypothetical protein